MKFIQNTDPDLYPREDSDLGKIAGLLEKKLRGLRSRTELIGAVLLVLESSVLEALVQAQRERKHKPRFEPGRLWSTEPTYAIDVEVGNSLYTIKFIWRFFGRTLTVMVQSSRVEKVQGGNFVNISAVESLIYLFKKVPGGVQVTQLRE